MKLILGILLTIAIFGCSSSSKKIKFDNDYLKGNWVVIAVSLANKDLTQIEPVTISSIKEQNEALSIYSFDEKGSFSIDTSGLQEIKGKYTLLDTVLTLKSDDNTIKKFFRATQVTDSTMAIIVDKSNESSEKLVYEFVKVKNITNEATKTNFDISNVKWKTPLAATADEAAIKDRLKTMLNYYSNYFSTLVKSGCRVFSEKKVFLPVKLYGGGLGLKGIEGVPDFITIMGSVANAAKAKDMLSKCFDSPFTYPDRDNFMQEYAEVLAHLEKQIK
jgi:hypothetical protein